ncbi:MAG: MFS transporter [Proteobacteria bacterium]|nr:MFS transporter [Pseudomonadota bacterium]
MNKTLHEGASVGGVKKVSWVTTIGYGSGDFGFNLYFAGLNLYLLYYYTDILNIDPAIAGLIIMLPVVWDGISDPLMGWIVTRTRSRFGNFRPYILFGAPLRGLSFVGMFAAPVWFPDHVVIACLVTHMIFRTAYTVASVPYSSLAAALTHSSQERGTMAGVRLMAAMVGGIVTAATMLELASYFGDGDMRQGFVHVAVVYGLLSSVMMAIIFLTTSEEVHLASNHSVTNRQTLSFLRHNRAFWVLCGASLVGIIGSAIGGKSIVYYVNYYAGLPDSVSDVMSIGILGAGIGIPLWTLAARLLSKRWVWVIGASGAALVNLALFFFDVKALASLSALAFCNGLIGGAVAVMFWSMLPDTVEYGQWRSGVRDDGIVFGLSQLIAKAGSGLGVGMIGLLLSAIGYTAGTDQSAETLQGIRAFAFLIPAAASALSAIVILFYPLDTQLHSRIVRGLARREQSNNAFT